MNEFIITFRECLEASLIIGIIYTVLDKNNLHQEKKILWYGVLASLAASIIVGIGLASINDVVGNTSFEKLFEAIFMYITAGILFYVIFWLARHVSDRKEIESFYFEKKIKSSTSTVLSSDFKELYLYAYGTNRKASETSLSENKEENNNITSLFDDKIDLINCEEWLLQLDYKQKSGHHKSKEILEKIKNIVLPTGIFPDITDFKFHADSEIYVLFKTDYGWVRFKDLGYGYQASMAWLFDFMKKMFDKYPDSENPLKEAAVVLIDELDLHLHPEWQRKIIGFLSKLFPKVQFIVTAHSPLILQSADEINLVMLKKQGDGVVIEQPKIPTFKGWTVEEILSELMELGEKTHSDDYLRLMANFDEALDEENYEQAQKAFEELKKILHENSEERTLLKVQMRMLSYD